MLSEHNFRLIFLCIYSCPQCIQNSSHNFPPFSRLPLINLIHRLLHISSLSCLVITLPPVPDSLIRPMLNKCGQKSFSHCLRTFFSLYLDHMLKFGCRSRCLSISHFQLSLWFLVPSLYSHNHFYEIVHSLITCLMEILWFPLQHISHTEWFLWYFWIIITSTSLYLHSLSSTSLLFSSHEIDHRSNSLVPITPQ